MSGQTFTVLIVDDDVHALEAMRRKLAVESWDVLTATSGAEALSQMELHDVTVVICDHFMPEMTGIELLNVLRTAFPNVVRILMTGEGNLDMATRAINESEVHRLLHKPCVEELVPAVQATLAQRENGLSEEARAELATLSKRERDVVELIASGLRVVQVAKTLFISVHTVRNHLKASYRKLDLNSQGQLVARYGAGVHHPRCHTSSPGR